MGVFSCAAVVRPGPSFLIPNKKLKLSPSWSSSTSSTTVAAASEDDRPSYSGSSPSARSRLDLLEQLRSAESPAEGLENVVNYRGVTIRDQLAQLVGDRDDDFSIPLGKNLKKVSPKFLTVAQKRNIKRQAYLNEVSQRNDTVFFATIGAFVIFPPIIILGIAIANVTRSGFTVNDIVARYKDKKKVEGNLPLPLEKENKATLKRKRDEQDIGAERETRSEEVLENQAVTIVKMMSKEIRMWKVKCDTLDMDRAEYEKDIKDAFKLLKEKMEEVKAKDEEISRWTVRLANAGKRHAREMEMLRDDMMNEAAKSVFEARIEMIKEYHAGEHGNSDLEEENAALQRIIDEKTGEVTSKVREKTEQAGDAQDNNTE